MACVYITIPVYNEIENIPKLAKQSLSLCEHLPVGLSAHFVLVDDGSSDGTSQLLEASFPPDIATVLKHPKNRGPGAAFATGFKFVLPQLAPDDWVLTMEGDNTSSCQLVPQMFTRANEGYDVILASPYLYGGTIINTSAFRRFLSFGANLFLKELLGLRGIMTMSSFFRLYRAPALQRVQKVFGDDLIETRGFEGVVELLIKLVMLKTSISEVPLILDTSQRMGKSKMRIVRNAVQLLSLLLKTRRWRCSIRDGGVLVNG